MLKTFGRRSLGVAFLGCCLVALGCSSRSNRLPVNGSVTVDGAPGSLTILTFWPEDPNAAPGTGGRVTTDEQGKFSIGDEKEGTGLVKGDYKVTFSRFVDKNGKAVHGGGKKSEAAYDVPSKESIPDAYREQTSTPVSAKVASDSTTFTFEVSTKK